MIEHPPLDLIHPVPFRGTVASRLTIGNLGSQHVERQITKAARVRSDRKSMVIAVAAATDCPKALIAALSSVDLARAADWVAGALEKETDALWRT